MLHVKREQIDEILTRGVDEIVEKESMERKMLSGNQMRIKFGIDPTSPDLHLGHAVVLRKLKQFQDLGHKIILLIGDFTATIGDPSGRVQTRPMLTEREVKRNMKNYIKQAAKIINVRKAEINYNSQWYKRKGAYFIMDLCSKFTLARVTERDDFQKRMQENQEISILEVIYPILQGYDSVEVRADIEIGGRDQKFNLLMGRRVQKKFNMPEQDILTTHLLEGTDGLKKMSKTAQNYIGLTEKPSEMYGKIMGIDDNLVIKYFELLTDVNINLVNKIENPRDKKALLAKTIVQIYHGQKEADNAQAEFNKIFKEKQLPSDINVFRVLNENCSILDLLCDSGLVKSRSQAQRLVEQGAVKVLTKGKEIKISNWKEKPSLENGSVLKVGNRKFVRIRK